MDALKIVFWHWWVVAVVLVAVETVVPGAAFIWMGVAAAVVGGALLVFPDMAWQAQLGLFAALALAAFLAARLIPKPEDGSTDQPHLNRRAEQYLGRTVLLESAIVNGRGRAFVGDTLWTVAGPDQPAGRSVRVVGVDGAVLRVEAAET